MVEQLPDTRAEPQAATTRQRGARPRIYGVDGLRFAAAVGVMLYHYLARESTAWGGELPVETFPVAGEHVIYAALGPELFFVVSGFVILMTAWGRDVPHVIASRVARLYPSYWVAVIATSVLLLWIWPQGKEISGGQVLANLTMAQTLLEVDHIDGVYWTLWTELRFYVLIIALVAIGITRRRVLTFCALWPLAGWAASALSLETASMVLVSGYAPLFAGGMLIYLLYRDGHGWLPWSLLAGNIALAVHNVVPAQLGSISRNTAYQPSAAVIAVLVVLCFAAVAALTITPLRRLGGPWLASLGVLTYPLYLLHEHWGWWLIGQLYPALGRWPTLLLTCAAAIGAAWLVHHGIEKRVGPRLRRAIDGGLRRLTAARAAARRVRRAPSDELPVVG